MGADGETCQLFIWIFNYYDGHSAGQYTLAINYV